MKPKTLSRFAVVENSHEKGLPTRREGGAAGKEVEVGEKDMEPETEL